MSIHASHSSFGPLTPSIDPPALEEAFLPIVSQFAQALDSIWHEQQLNVSVDVGSRLYIMAKRNWGFEQLHGLKDFGVRNS